MGLLGGCLPPVTLKEQSLGVQGETAPFLGAGEGVGHLGKRRLAESEGFEQPS